MNLGNKCFLSFGVFLASQSWTDGNMTVDMAIMCKQKVGKYNIDGVKQHIKKYNPIVRKII